MSKAKTLATTVSTGGVLDNPSAIPAANISGAVGSATNIAGGSNGTVPYQSASGTTQMLAVGTAGQVLQTNGVGAPSWATPASATTATNIAGGSNGTIPYQSASGTTQMLAAGTSGQLLQSNGVAAPSWLTFAAGTSITRTTKTANYTLVAGDKGNLVVATSGTFTFSFTAAATLGAGWCVYLQNSGTGEVTLDPNASETIDGLTSYILYSGEARLIVCDGTSFYSIILSCFTLNYASGVSTFTKPPGYTSFIVNVYGGGGGGGSGGKGSQIDAMGGTGGGGGSLKTATILSSNVAATETVTVGAGGAGGAAQATNESSGVQGTTGGTSSFGSLLSTFGGIRGNAGAYFANDAAGGNGGGNVNTGTGGNFNGGGGVANSAGSNSAYGGGGGGGSGNSGTAQSGSAGGSSIYAGGGGGGGGGFGNGVDTNGGAGGSNTGISGGGGAGGVGSTSTPPVNQTAFGLGGGGGYFNNNGVRSSSAGANAGLCAGGGGGGAGWSGNFSSGAGGSGGSGFVLVVGVA